MRLGAILGAGATAMLMLTAAQGPSTLTGVSGGLWEVSGAPGIKAPVRQCVTDVAVLAQFEHRQKACTRKLLSTAGTHSVVGYQCPAGDFGRSEITILTPRSLKIETQGISDRLPFSYVLQARRVGDCPERG